VQNVSPFSESSTQSQKPSNTPRDLNFTKAPLLANHSESTLQAAQSLEFLALKEISQALEAKLHTVQS